MAVISVWDYVNVGGKVDVLVAFPVFNYAYLPLASGRGSVPATNAAAYEQLWKLGELEDEVEPRFRNIMHRVSGDRYGGSAGPPIEQQFMGQVAEIDLALSRWDKEVFGLLNKNGGLHKQETLGAANATNALRLTDYGALMLIDFSFRLLLVPTRDSSFVMNFPCCILESDFGTNASTKYSRLSMRVTAHRTPERHWSNRTGSVGVAGSTIGVLVNNDLTGTPSPYVLTNYNPT